MFVIRLAGVPFEALDRLATPATLAGAREVVAAEADLARGAELALAALRHPNSPYAAKTVDRARRALGQRARLPNDARTLTPELTAYATQHADVTTLRETLEMTLRDELAHARRELAVAAAGPLRRYSVFAASSSVSERLDGAGDGAGDRGWRERATDRLHLNYLQRVAAKNDTISEFGPTGWGRLDRNARGIELAPVPGIALRDVFLEKWVSTALAEAMTSDPLARLEASPRLHPHGRWTGSTFERDDLEGADASRPLSARDLAVLARVDGHTPAHAHADIETLTQLALDGVVLWRFEAPVLEPHRAQFLRADVEAWRAGPARSRWLPIVTRLVDAPVRFAEADVDERRAIIGEVEVTLRGLRDGHAAEADRGRVLYAATNVIGEECLRTCNFTLGGDVAARFEAEAAPWLDLFTDTASHAWQHVSRRMLQLHEGAPRRDGIVPLLAFLRHADQAGVPLGRDGIAQLASEAFREVQRAFEAHLDARADAPEIELTVEDCHLVRRQFAPPPSPVCPSVDLQIAASSLAAITAGHYQMVVGEVNLVCPIAAHVFYWGCPDRAELDAEIRRLVGTTRACHASVRVMDRANHNAFHWPEIFGDGWTGVVADRLAPGRRTVAPSAAQVVARGGMLHVIGPGDQDLGALVTPWDMPFALGIHPFLFHRNRHMARLRSGRTILQRRSWTVSVEELPGRHQGVSAMLLAAVDKLRSARDLPRHVFVRPTDSVLARISSSGRDKDVKPFFVDLESYLFCEALHHRLTKYGELELTEMLPSPDQLPWQEADGRRTFELRIACGPAPTVPT